MIGPNGVAVQNALQLGDGLQQRAGSLPCTSQDAFAASGADPPLPAPRRRRDDDVGLDGEDGVGPDGPWDAPWPAPVLDEAPGPMPLARLRWKDLDEAHRLDGVLAESGTPVRAQLTRHDPLCSTVCSTALRYCDIRAPSNSNCEVLCNAWRWHSKCANLSKSCACQTPLSPGNSVQPTKGDSCADSLVRNTWQSLVGLTTLMDSSRCAGAAGTWLLPHEHHWPAFVCSHPSPRSRPPRDHPLRLSCAIFRTSVEVHPAWPAEPLAKCCVCLAVSPVPFWFWRWRAARPLPAACAPFGMFKEATICCARARPAPGGGTAPQAARNLPEANMDICGLTGGCKLVGGAATEAIGGLDGGHTLGDEADCAMGGTRCSMDVIRSDMVVTTSRT
eukprot:6454994-Amphidinium_carterae.2